MPKIKEIIHRNGGLSGIPNGCYMNSGLQYLVSDPSFRKRLAEFQDKKPSLTNKASEDYKKCEEIYNLCLGILGDGYEEDITVAGKSVKLKGIAKNNTILNEDIEYVDGIVDAKDRRAQQDCHEFVHRVYDLFDNALGYDGTNNINPVSAFSVSKISCKRGHSSVPKNQASPIISLIFAQIGKDGFILESKDADVYYNCETLGCGEKTVSQSLDYYPRRDKSFSIQIGRNPDNINKRRDQINLFDKKFKDPELDVVDFIGDKVNKKEKYTISSIVCHLGRQWENGHYVQYTRVGEDKWVCFNDSQVRVLTEKEVAEETKNDAYVINYIPEKDKEKEFDLRKRRLSKEIIDQIESKKPIPSIDQEELEKLINFDNYTPEYNGRFSVDQVIYFQNVLLEELDKKEFLTNHPYHGDWWVFPSTTRNPARKKFDYSENDSDFYKTLGEKQFNFYIDFIEEFNKISKAKVDTFDSKSVSKFVQCVYRIAKHSEKFRQENLELLDNFTKNIQYSIDHGKLKFADTFHYHNEFHHLKILIEEEKEKSPPSSDKNKKPQDSKGKGSSPSGESPEFEFIEPPILDKNIQNSYNKVQASNDLNNILGLIAAKNAKVSPRIQKEEAFDEKIKKIRKKDAENDNSGLIIGTVILILIAAVVGFLVYNNYSQGAGQVSPVPTPNNLDDVQNNSIAVK